MGIDGLEGGRVEAGWSGEGDADVGGGTDSEGWLCVWVVVSQGDGTP